MKHEELPSHFRIMFENVMTRYNLPLIRLGVVNPSDNPYFAVEEKHVEGCIVRRLGTKPFNDHTLLLVEREDGTLWRIRLCNFQTYEEIKEFEK